MMHDYIRKKSQEKNRGTGRMEARRTKAPLPQILQVHIEKKTEAGIGIGKPLPIFGPFGTSEYHATVSSIKTNVQPGNGTALVASRDEKERKNKGKLPVIFAA